MKEIGKITVDMGRVMRPSWMGEIIRVSFWTTNRMELGDTFGAMESNTMGIGLMVRNMDSGTGQASKGTLTQVIGTKERLVVRGFINGSMGIATRESSVIHWSREWVWKYSAMGIGLKASTWMENQKDRDCTIGLMEVNLEVILFYFI